MVHVLPKARHSNHYVRLNQAMSPRTSQPDASQRLLVDGSKLRFYNEHRLESSFAPSLYKPQQRGLHSLGRNTERAGWVKGNLNTFKSWLNLASLFKSLHNTEATRLWRVCDVPTFM